MTIRCLSLTCIVFFSRTWLIDQILQKPDAERSATVTKVKNIDSDDDEGDVNVESAEKEPKVEANLSLSRNNIEYDHITSNEENVKLEIVLEPVSDEETDLGDGNDCEANDSLRECYVSIERLEERYDQVNVEELSEKVFSDDLSDSCVVECAICDKHMMAHRFRSHTAAQHNLPISQYKEHFGNQPVFVKTTYHLCKLCGKEILLDLDSVASHVRSHKVSIKEYNSKYMILKKKTVDQACEKVSVENNLVKKKKLECKAVQVRVRKRHLNVKSVCVRLQKITVKVKNVEVNLEPVVVEKHVVMKEQNPVSCSPHKNLVSILNDEDSPNIGDCLVKGKETRSQRCSRKPTVKSPYVGCKLGCQKLIEEDPNKRRIPDWAQEGPLKRSLLIRINPDHVFETCEPPDLADIFPCSATTFYCRDIWNSPV